MYVHIYIQHICICAPCLLQGVSVCMCVFAVDGEDNVAGLFLNTTVVRKPATRNHACSKGRE